MFTDYFPSRHLSTTNFQKSLWDSVYHDTHLVVNLTFWERRFSDSTSSKLNEQ